MVEQQYTRRGFLKMSVGAGLGMMGLANRGITEAIGFGLQDIAKSLLYNEPLVPFSPIVAKQYFLWVLKNSASLRQCSTDIAETFSRDRISQIKEVLMRASRVVMSKTPSETNNKRVVLFCLAANGFLNTNNAGEQYPGYLSGQRSVDPGFDKTVHLFTAAHFAYELKYFLSHNNGDKVRPFVVGAERSMDLVGRDNIKKIIKAFSHTSQWDFVYKPGIISDNPIDHLIEEWIMGSEIAYEILTTVQENGDYTAHTSKRNAISFAWHRLRGNGQRVNTLVDEVLQKGPNASLAHGLYDIGVVRDMVATQVGIWTGLWLHAHPIDTLEIPFDNTPDNPQTLYSQNQHYQLVLS